MTARLIILLIVSLSMTGCGMGETNYAPVINRSASTQNIHVVSKGDTLYSIAFRYGLDYRQLAADNGIQPPYRIHSGQVIYLSNAPPELRQKIHKNAKKTTPKRNYSAKPVSKKRQQANNYYQKVNSWIWPARGKVIEGFHLSKPVNAGINIAGKMGEPIRATASGRVVYSGNGIFGYGNLIIVQHNQEYLSAYGHNKRNIVKEGQWVKQGQVIAYMGDSASKRVMLHFEIRRRGKPSNPLYYLRKTG